MKKPFLLFALKCSVILYFAACTRLEHYTNDKSATPVVTEGAWKVDLYMDAGQDKTNELSGYTFTFNPEGNLLVKKDGRKVTGNWSEDDIAKKIMINIGKGEPALQKLNVNWDVTRINKTAITLRSKDSRYSGSINMSPISM